MSVVKAVVDTQIFLRAAINRKSLPAKILFDMSNRYQLVTSQSIVDEVRDVLFRPKLRIKFLHLTDEIANEVINLLTSAEMVTPEHVPAIARDPKDDVFLACAKAAEAAYIVSEDQDLLVLNPYDDIQIVNVSKFFSVLQSD